MLNVVRAWILLSTLLAGAGWVLSAFHELNHIGYAIVFVLAFCGNLRIDTKQQCPD
jgi:hypothetical protein